MKDYLFLGYLLLVMVSLPREHFRVFSWEYGMSHFSNKCHIWGWLADMVQIIKKNVILR